jgi:hypothetical protein
MENLKAPKGAFAGQENSRNKFYSLCRHTFNIENEQKLEHFLSLSKI